MDALNYDTAIAALIDHTLLKPDAVEAEILKLCEEAIAYGFASVCINPCWVRLCSNTLIGKSPKVCTVIGFPLGSNRTEIKVHEAELAAADGAREFDMVINVGQLKQGESAFVEQDIAAVTAAVKSISIQNTVKVILETCLLSGDEIKAACHLSRKAGADFVKTSTGFSKAGASLEAVNLMRSVVGQEMGVKASGGVRDRFTALAMIDAGASRIGTSSSIAIVSS